MICYEFKGGIGTASRVLNAKYGGYTVGVLAQCNYGRRSQLRVGGVPVGHEIPGHVHDDDVGSIIIVVATDAPLIPTQLKRVAKHVALGLGRGGGYSGDGSGDIFVAFRQQTLELREARAFVKSPCCLMSGWMTSFSRPYRPRKKPWSMQWSQRKR